MGNGTAVVRLVKSEREAGNFQPGVSLGCVWLGLLWRGVRIGPTLSTDNYSREEGGLGLRLV